MTDETVHKSTRTTTRSVVAAYLRRVADAFDRGDPLPVDESVTVDVPDGTELEVDVEREDDAVTYELEFAWPAGDATVDTDADAPAPDDADADASEDAAAADAEPATAASAGSGGTFELYRDKAGEWRWRLRHRNGNVIADGGEGYGKKANAVNGIESVKANAPGAAVEEQD